MTGPPPATAAVRVAVRRHLQDVTGPVVAAVSGGADSLALAAALAFERPDSAAVIVDHGLQAGSAKVAAHAAEQCRSLGLSATVRKAAVTVTVSGDGGPEARARTARYAVLDEVDATVLLGHTRDDQAETVLLGLLRGSGARALSGMPPARGHYRRPLLDLSRLTTRQACDEAGLTPWQDPQNADRSFLRVEVRTILDGLEVSDGLVRSARLLREDADALDALAEAQDDVAALAAMLPALRARSLKKWAEIQSGRAVTSVQVDSLRALVENWHGQGPVSLAGGGRVRRVGGRLAFEA